VLSPPGVFPYPGKYLKVIELQELIKTKVFEHGGEYEWRSINVEA